MLTLLVLLGLVLAAFAWPSPSVPLVCLRMDMGPLVAGGGASLATKRVPFNCRIHKIAAGIQGIDDATSVVVDPEVGTTDLLATPLTVATGSAIVSGGAVSDPDDVLTLDEGDVLHMDVVPTGGSTPDVVGAWCEVWVQRLP